MNYSEILLQVDQSEPITFEEFVRINTSHDVDPLTQNELNQVQNLLLKESIFLGMGVEIKRVK